MDPNLQGQNVSGEGDAFNAALQAVVAEEVAKLGIKPGQAEQVKPEPLKINVGGQEYNFENQEKLSQALNQMVQGYSNQMAQLQAQLEAVPQPGQQVQGEDTPQFDMKQYVQMMEKDPLKAAEYVDSHRYFNGKVENPSTVIRESLIKSAELERVVAAYQFKDAHPEYQPTPQNAQKIEQIRQALNLPATFDGLEAAYATAITKGFLPDPRMEQMKQQMQQQFNGQQQQAPRFAPPPVPSNQGLSSGMQLSMDAAEDLSADQIASILNKIGR